MATGPLHLVPDVDATETSMHQMVTALKAFDLAIETASIDRSRQLHERLFAIAQMVEATDATLRLHWDDLLAKGADY
jgi:hypothetical protein